MTRASARTRPTLFTLLVAVLGTAPLGLSAVTGATAADKPASGTSIEIERTVAASVESVRARVLDFESYERWVPIVQEVEVVEQDETVAVVRFRYRIVRAGDFELTRRFRHQDEGRIDFDSASGTLGRLSGSWLFESDPDHPEHTRVRYRATLEPGFPAPEFLVRYILKSEAPSLLDALASDA